MELNISLDKKHFKSDSINNGRAISSFFEKLTNNIFEQSYKYWKQHKKITGSGEIPILMKERNLYSTFAVAVDRITPVHLSEFSFNPSDYKKTDSSRRVDLWCLHKEGKNGKPINFFIELKKGYYCLNKKTQQSFHKNVAEDIKSLVKQTKIIKNISPGWENIDDAFIGISIIHGYYKPDNLKYNHKDVIQNINNQIDKRLNVQLLTSTWHIPQEMDIQWEKERCKFITVAGIVLSNKKRT